MQQEPRVTNYNTSAGRQEMAKLAEKDTVRRERANVEVSDELIDEIDSVLETNAMETVRAFLQKPGQ